MRYYDDIAGTAKVYASGLVVFYHHNSSQGRPRDELKQYAKRSRTYRIKRNLIRSASIELFTNKVNKIIFLTYTFAFDVTEMDAARVWNNHLKSLKKTYNAENYVWVKERQKNGRLHYHLLIDIPKFRVSNLQDSFNVSVRGVCGDVRVSNNSVRLGKRPIVSNIRAVANYLAKYISKDFTEYERPAYGVSNDLRGCFFRCHPSDLELIWKQFQIDNIVVKDYFDLYRVRNDTLFYDNWSDLKLLFDNS